MLSLREKMETTDDFLIGVELVSTRGSIAEAQAVKARAFAQHLVQEPDVDWISITDNAGGNPMLAPPALGKPILYAGKEVVIHLTCKDMNRNALESEAWSLESEGFHNILAMTGDYPVAGSDGAAMPVFDIDSVALVSMLNRMNEGVTHASRGATGNGRRLGQTRFFVGAVTTNFKMHEGEVMPQYFKLERKIKAGARFIINQIGYDAQKMHELIAWVRRRGLDATFMIGNVYVLNPRVAELFHRKRIPGVVVSDALLEVCRREAESPDRGRRFFVELAAKQMAIYRGLGYRGIYLGGVHDFETVREVLDLEASFAPDDWQAFAAEIAYSRDGEFFFFAQIKDEGRIDPDRVNPDYETSLRNRKAAGRPPWSYRLSKRTHRLMFDPDARLARWGKRVSAGARNPMQGPKPVRLAEHLSKAVLFRCRDCGDCSLPETAYLCPESQCAKNQRNGPCGGTRNGMCEVDGFGRCIWLRAYERLKSDGAETTLLDHAPVVQNQLLRGTSSWANHWQGRDHASRMAGAAPEITQS